MRNNAVNRVPASGATQSTTSRSGFAHAPDGARLYYEARGAGPAVVLIHSDDTVDRRMWNPQLPAFAAHHLTIRYDGRCHGQSERTTERYLPAEDLNGVIDAVGVERAHLVGLGEGGECAVDFALAHPSKTGRLVLVNSGLPGYMPTGFKENLGEFVAGLWETLGPIVPAIEEAKATGNATRLVELLLDQSAPLLGPEPSEANCSLLREMLADNVRLLWEYPPPRGWRKRPSRRRLKTITSPALVLLGQESNQVLVDIAAILVSDIPAARKVVLPGSHQLVNMTQPEEFNELVLEFLSGSE